jgi:hypothetical protein
MARLSRLFSRKDAGPPASDPHAQKSQRRVAEVTAAPASSPLPLPAQTAGSAFPAATPPHGSVEDGAREHGATPETDAAAQQDGAPARRHHLADLRTPAQADPSLKVRLKQCWLFMIATDEISRSTVDPRDSHTEHRPLSQLPTTLEQASCCSPVVLSGVF